MIQALAVTVASLIFVASFVALVRRFSGWSQLERHYICPENQSHETSIGSYQGVSASARFARISLSVELYPSSVWLQPTFPLSIAMKAIDIPWHAIDDVSVQHGLFGDRTVIRIRHAEVPISVKGRAGKRLFEWALARRNGAQDSRHPG